MCQIFSRRRSHDYYFESQFIMHYNMIISRTDPGIGISKSNVQLLLELANDYKYASNNVQYNGVHDNLTSKQIN